jgi:hypothetical protein
MAICAVTSLTEAIGGGLLRLVFGGLWECFGADAEFC